MRLDLKIIISWLKSWGRKIFGFDFIATHPFPSQEGTTFFFYKVPLFLRGGFRVSLSLSKYFSHSLFGGDCEFARLRGWVVLDENYF
jgi:hypothetical protein